MAVEPLIKDFLPKLKRNKSFLAYLLVTLNTALLAGLLWYLGVFIHDSLTATIILAVQFSTNMIVAAIVLNSITKPIKNITSALSHISGELSTDKPPLLNDKKLAKHGLDTLIKKIYELSAAQAIDIEQETNEEKPTPAIQGYQDSLAKSLDETTCGFVVFNKDRQITYANKAAPVRVDNEGKITLDLIFGEVDSINNWWNECEETAIKAEKTWSRISNKIPNEEDRRIFDVLATYNKGSENEVILVLVDRTKLYEVSEKELDFIAFAAHELRGPITVIKGYIDVLQDELDETIDDEQKELFNRLRVSASKLSGYINNILNTSKYDRRHLKMHLSETTVAKVYNTISDDMSLRASSQNRLLTVEIPEDIPTIAADRTSLGEVLSNLIDNAIKYSNEGGAVNVSANLNGEFVDISIQDFGIGMPGNVVGNLFQKFYRSHRSRETVAGTGIGLYISKAIVEAHGGTVLVKSEEGRGSTFTVSLPTYRSIADKLEQGDNEKLIKKEGAGSWIKNHSVFRG